MSTSPAQLAANRQNALKSRGSKAPEGKAASRLNAFRQTLARQGDQLGEGEDGRRVAERSLMLARELGATGASGQILAHRAAVLSIRMERLAERERVAVHADIAEAKCRFDRDRAEELARAIEAFEEVDPRGAASELEQSPEGVDYLLGVWKSVHIAMGRSDDQAAANRAMILLGLNADGAAAMDSAVLAERVAAEMVRLQALADSMIGFDRWLSQARDEAGLLARFNPSPEATLARRYEAAAERGVYHAFRAIAQIRRDQGLEPLKLEAPILQTPNAPTTPIPRPVDSPRATPSPASLGSFRAVVLASAIPEVNSLLSLLEPAAFPEPNRKKRPDLRKLAAKRR